MSYLRAVNEEYEVWISDASKRVAKSIARYKLICLKLGRYRQ